MGRDVTGFRTEKRPSGKPNGVAHGTVHVAPRIAMERVEAKDYEAEDHAAKDTHVEESHEKQDVLSVKSTNCEPDPTEGKIAKTEAMKSSDKKLGSPLKPSSDSTAATEIQAPPVMNSSANKSENHENGAQTVDAVSNCSSKDMDLHSPMTSQKLHQNYPMMSRKLRIQDEDDNWSMASSTAASVRTVKSKVTVPVAPSFKCSERSARRKEYYTKLEEKHKALEAEKQEYAARTKEEEEAAIKQLRKAMTYRANPVPSFYREGPPPKPELKKLPVTRAKSPNLTRRKSCSDAVAASPEEKKASARCRHSTGVYKQGSPSPTTPKSKDRVTGRLSNGALRAKEPTKLVKAKKESPLKETPIKEIKETPVAQSNGTPMQETEEEAPMKVKNEASVKEIKEIPVIETEAASHTMTEHVTEDTAAQSWSN
ncbi:protein WVD2-like 2 [Capsicum annuum]|uniref:protein WVD2-like 2 n=1 Tax=Capsicum annuum TaxID=4072 RepID=UPI0007BF3866|nr:protein WVD2-like 2 [Capsicum annuum]XP_016538359.1 protein WVD2-like 2 [Capsicum annuum]XP_047250520.1 protein WVD2-like 2 [Capsicum annuum]